MVGLAMTSWCIRGLAMMIVLSPVLAAAQAIPPGQEGELGKLLPPEPGTRICHEQVFSADDLAAHPDQTVAAMTLRIAYHRFEPDQFYPEGQRNYYFALVARLRDTDRALTAIGECAPWGDKVSCGVDCDGGGFTFTISGKDAVRIDFGEDARLRMTAGCSEEAGAVDFTPGPADREFVLSKIGDDRCPAYEDW
jgi:hypothetical protein